MGVEKILDREQALQRGRETQSLGRCIVFTNGCFDLLTPGHVHLLSEAKRMGDLLVVGLNTDASIRSIKGPERPIYSERDRAFLLSAIEWVDVVTLFDELTPVDLIVALHPDVLVKGEEYAVPDIVGAKEVMSWGGSVCRVSMKEGISTTRTIEKIRQVGEKTGCHDE